MAGCEPLSVNGGPVGVLVLHGFTGSPFSMRPLAERFADAGFSVEMPLLPGHGTAVEDMIPTRFEDWSGGAEAAFQSLAARTEKVFVVGLSMGGTLTCWLAEKHPTIAGIVLVNPTELPLDVVLESPFRRLLGTRAPLVNDGSVSATQHLGPSDALFLLRAEVDTTPPAGVRDLRIGP